MRIIQILYNIDQIPELSISKYHYVVEVVLEHRLSKSIPLAHVYDHFMKLQLKHIHTTPFNF